MARLLGPRQQHAELPFGFAQFKHNVHRGILSRGGCADVIEIQHFDPPRLDRSSTTQSYLSATRRPIESTNHGYPRSTSLSPRTSQRSSRLRKLMPSRLTRNCPG